ncbi:MAG: hypothetical protein AAGE18_14635 [Pseudomonadota bacterium]
MSPAEALRQRGWVRFPKDPAIAAWSAAVRPIAARIAADPAQQATWLRHDGTWFVGVQALPNGPNGRVANGPPLTGAAIRFLEGMLGQGPIAWERAQISVCYPGYPRQGPGESDGAARYRRQRDAAHVDGLLAEGPERRRYLREHHAFLLGLPLVPVASGAAPFVVWEGSHALMREAFREALADQPEDRWGEVDLTEVYHAARRQVFAQCRRVVISAAPGEAYVVHRLALHGVAPWAPGATAPAEGRMIAYFRPECGMTAPDWLDAP